MLPDFTRPSLFNGVMYSRSRSGLACPVRCRITGGHCAREVCEVRGIKMLTLEMTTCVRSILDIFYNFQTKIRIFGTKSIRLV